jgi:hypothetical protein
VLPATICVDTPLQVNSLMKLGTGKSATLHLVLRALIVLRTRSSMCVLRTRVFELSGLSVQVYAEAGTE